MNELIEAQAKLELIGEKVAVIERIAQELTDMTNQLMEQAERLESLVK